MSRPTLDQYLMQLAKVAATRTTCIRRGVGCVLADSRGHILAIGYNGVAAGLPHCNEVELVPVYHDDPRVLYDLARFAWKFNGSYTKRFNNLEQDNLRQCVGHDETVPHACAGHNLPPGRDNCEAVHAEQNALLQCSDPWGIETAYVTLSPCKACLKLLLGTSCKRLVVAELHADIEPLALWEKAGRSWDLLTD